MAEEGSDHEGSPPPAKMARMRNTGRRPFFHRVHKQITKHKVTISNAIEQLNTDWASFCFVKIINCNADEPCCFSQAYCKTVRNFEESSSDKQGVTLIPQLFNLSFVQMFIDMTGDIEKQMTDQQLRALEKLATFLDTISDANKILREQLADPSLKGGQWAAVLGIHVLRKLAVSNEMKIDLDYSNLPDNMQCPCGCKNPIKVGDNSIGHEKVWHGSVDIILGHVAVAVSKSSTEEGISEENSSAFELKRENLEDARHQLVAESIIFAFAMHGGIVPLIGISKEDIKIFIYVPDEDLLYESTELPLFAFPLLGKQLHMSSLVALWIIINYECFCTGVKSSHIELGYKADLKKFLGEDKFDIYQHRIRMGGLKHVVSDKNQYKAGENMGMFKIV